MIFLKVLTLISVRIHQKNVIYVSIIILCLKIFNYQRYLCDWCHDMSVKALSMQHLTIIYHNRHAYRVNFMFMSKNAFNLIKNLIIIDKKGTL